MLLAVTLIDELFASKRSQTITASAAVLVSPWHPVFIGGHWTFPCSVRMPSLVYMDCVYNVVLSTRHIVVINDVEFITLGHGMVGNPVLEHALFGTQVGCRLLFACFHAT